MQVFCVYSKAQLGSNYLTTYDYPLAGLQRAGAILVEEAEFIRTRANVQPDDKVVGFFVADELTCAIYETVRPQNRWTYLVDTKVRPDGTGAYEGRLRYFERLGISHTVITYPIERDVKVLIEAGVTPVVLPCCVSRRRQRTPKYNGVVMTGTFDTDFYPTRYRLGELFRAQLPGIAGLPVPRGHVTDTAPVIRGEAYYEMLNTCQMGVVDRAGVRDYMVPKYVEFGMCHVLPIGDCPSYMPEEMKRLMVNVENVSDEEVVQEVKRLLANPSELQRRQDVYSDLVHRHYDLTANTQRVLQEITLL